MYIDNDKRWKNEWTKIELELRSALSAGIINKNS